MTTTPTACTRCGQPHPACHAHNRQGNPCRRTPEPAQTVCRYHGGASPQARAKAAQRLATAKAEAEVARLGARRDIHPADALLELVHWTAGEVDYWRTRVVLLAEEDEEALTWGTTKTKTGGDDHGTTEEAGPNVAYRMLTDASNRLANYCAAALKAGVEERRVRLAEKQGALVADVIRGILTAMFDVVVSTLRDAGQSDDAIVSALQTAWENAMPEVVPHHLRQLAAAPEGA